MYARTDGERTMTFGVSGKLYRNGLIMFDRETRSLWSHVTGQAIEGPLTGATLKPIAATLTTWEGWVSLYPDTLVLSKRKSPYGRSEYESDPYGSYYVSGRAGIHGRATEDKRLELKDLVLGALVAGRPKAYAFKDLARERVINDAVAGAPVLVVAEPIIYKPFQLETGQVTAVAYERTIQGVVRTFERVPAKDEQEPLIKDRESGSTWRALTGEAIEGPLKGQTLKRLISTTAFWFGWHDYFPDTELYARGG